MKGIFLNKRTLLSIPKIIFTPRLLKPLSASVLTSVWILLFAGCWSAGLHQTNGGNRVDLTKVPFERLRDIEFVTIFRKPGNVFESPAAVYLISQENLRRSGATNIPDALRSVPGMQVAQHNANSWAVTLRGFSGLSRGISGQFANKLLVLNEGRSIYTPLFSGVSWGAQDVLLDDIDRIEVIRGPGASLWGANAVNGIINIISKDARDTQGGLISSGIGTEQRTFTHFRYGGSIGEENYFRVYGKYLKVDDLVDSTGARGADGWHIFRGGFRLDSHLAQGRLVTFEGEIYDGQLGQTYNLFVSRQPPFQKIFDFDTKISGGHVLGRWKQQFSSSSDMELQLYFDRVKRNEAVVKGRIDTYDFDFHHRFSLNTRQELIWGTGYRLTNDRFDSTDGFSLNPSTRKTHLLSAFVQNETTLIPSHLNLTIGSKFEHNDYTGFEFQPSGRLLWTPNDQNAFWGAVSRAVRTPSRGEQDATIFLQALQDTIPSTFRVVYGNPDFGSESLLAFEIGYRQRPADELTFDLTTFYNRYDNLRTEETEPIPLRDPPNFISRINIGNGMSGKAYGFEAATNWQVSNNWRIRAAYSYLKLQLDLDLSAQDIIGETTEGQSPSKQFFVNSFLAPTKTLELDFRLRYVDDLPSLGISNFLTLDLRLGWQVTQNFELSFVGQNLLHKRHDESSTFLTVEDRRIRSGTVATEIQRSVYTKVTWSL